MTIGELQYLITVNDKTDEGIQKSEGKIQKAEKQLTAFGIARAQMVMDFAKKAASSAVNAFKNTVKSAVSAYADYEQLVGGVETLFKGSADKVLKYADQAYKTVGVSANEYMQNVTSFSGSLLQALEWDTSKAADIADMAMQDMADNANKMGSSMDSIQHAYQGFSKQNYTMLDNLKLGYGGTKGEMERLIEDANKLRKEQGKNSDLTIEKYSDVIEAIHTIQEEMGITGTTALEAEKTISGSIGMTKAAWKDLLMNIGAGRDVKKATKNFTDSLKNTIKNIIPVVKTSIKGIFEAVRASMPEIKAAIADLFSGFKGKLPVNNILDFVQSKLSGILGFVRLVSDLITDFPNTMKVLENSDDPWLNGFASLLGLADSLFTKIQEGTEESGSLLLGMFTGVGEFAGELIESIATWLEDDANVEKLTTSIENVVTAIVNALIKAIPPLINTIVDLVKNGAPKLVEAGKKVGLSIWNALPDEAKVVVGAVGAKTGINLAKGLSQKGKATVDTVKSVVDYLRPSRAANVANGARAVTPESAAEATRTFYDTIDDLAAHADDALTPQPGAAVNGARAITPESAAESTNLISQSADDIANASDDVAAALVQAGDDIARETPNFLTNLKNVFSNKLIEVGTSFNPFDFFNQSMVSDAFFNNTYLGNALQNSLSELLSGRALNGRGNLGDWWADTKKSWTTDLLDNLGASNPDMIGGIAWWTNVAIKAGGMWDSAKESFRDNISKPVTEFVNDVADITTNWNIVPHISGRTWWTPTADTMAQFLLGGAGSGGGTVGHKGATLGATNAGSTAQRHAKGNWNVPYDDYPALLHRGEMVLTKSQARQFRDGAESGGVSGDAIAAAVETAMSKVYVMLSGEKVGDLTTKRIKKNINASSYARMRALGG